MLPREPLLLDFVENVSRDGTRLRIPPYGSGLTALVGLDKANPSEPKNVATAAFTDNGSVR